MSSFERLATEMMRRHAPEGFGIDFASFARKGNLVTLSGALPRTLHFGVITLDLDSGVVTFVDEDHRDGGEDVIGRVTLSVEQLESLRRA
jgi:hypothetical protein